MVIDKRRRLLLCVLVMASACSIACVLLSPSLRSRYYRWQLQSDNINSVKNGIAHLAQMRCRAAFVYVVDVYKRRYHELPLRIRSGNIA
jgi:hypothetical protein